MREFALILFLLLLGSCEGPSSGHLPPPGALPGVGGDCPAHAADYPPRPYFGGLGWTPEPDFLAVGGASVLKDYYCPGAAAPRLLVVRVHAAWCGPCQWAAAHSGALLSGADAGRLSFVDALAFDADNQPATPAALSAWTARYDAPLRAIVPDNAHWLGHYDVNVDGVRHLPLVVLLDTRDMKAQAILSNPSNEELLSAAAQVLATLDGKPPVTVSAAGLIEGRFTRDRWEQIREMALPLDLAPPADPTNRYEGRADAVSLGRQVFHDERLGAAGTVGCVTCHLRDRARTDGRPTALGVSPAGAPVRGDRNTPSLLGVAFGRWQLWDGRADSLWAQALGPFEDTQEISSNRLRVVRTVLTRYPGEYRTVFGTVPDFSGLPADGRPGTPAWEAMPAATRQLVTATFVNVGKAIAAYVRQIVPAPVALDRYARGDLGALTEQEKDGLLRFFDVGCIQCHHGWRLSDGSWHANYFPTGRKDCEADVGREAGAAAYAVSEFRGDGIHSDDRAAGARLVGTYRLTGRFKTPTLRGVADTAPYTHGGAVPDLAALVKLYSEGGLPDSDPVMMGEPPSPPGCPTPRPARTRGDRDLAIVRFHAGPRKDPAADAALVAFLRTLRAAAVDPN